MALFGSFAGKCVMAWRLPGHSYVAEVVSLLLFNHTSIRDLSPYERFRLDLHRSDTIPSRTDLTLEAHLSSCRDENYGNAIECYGACHETPQDIVDADQCRF